jgi:membrane associated rhomboid family serine protease
VSIDPPDSSDPQDVIDPELLAAGYLPPDPDEPRPLEFWSAVGDVRPWGTMLVLLAWGVLFLLEGRGGAFENAGAMAAWGANATGLDAGASAWRLLASTFLHAGVAHVFFNATSLLVVAPAVERLFTRWGFWVVYAAGGATASLASLAWRTVHEGGASSLSVGGSGAIFALGGALLVAAIRLRGRLAPSRARAFAAALLYLLAPALASGMTRHGTDNAAHAAGLAGGAVLGLLLPISPRLGGPRTPLALRLLAALCALALAASLALALRGGLAYRG